MSIEFRSQGPVAVVTIDRPEVANAIDRPTAAALADAFRRFEADESLHVAVLTGANGTFCAGADLKAMREPGMERASRLDRDGDGPVGPTRMLLAKPVIAAVEGHAVAGGLELAAWCDLRVAAENAVFGVYCRRWGIPLMDGGTIRLARLIGHSHALDLILTGRGVSGDEALRMGLANRLVPPGTALDVKSPPRHRPEPYRSGAPTQRLSVLRDSPRCGAGIRFSGEVDALYRRARRARRRGRARGSAAAARPPDRRRRVGGAQRSSAARIEQRARAARACREGHARVVRLPDDGAGVPRISLGEPHPGAAGPVRRPLHPALRSYDRLVLRFLGGSATRYGAESVDAGRAIVKTVLLRQGGDQLPV